MRLRILRTMIIVVCGLALAGAPAWAKTHKSGKHSGSKHNKTRKSKKARGQKSISEDRVREIQQALIRENYLQGEPSGVLDSSTRSALVKFQGDNGWQTKVVPDSRALIKLGLGPSRENLLNPETAAVAMPGGIVTGGQQ